MSETPSSPLLVALMLPVVSALGLLVAVHLPTRTSLSRRRLAAGLAMGLLAMLAVLLQPFTGQAREVLTEVLGADRAGDVMASTLSPLVEELCKLAAVAMLVRSRPLADRIALAVAVGLGFAVPEAWAYVVTTEHDVVLVAVMRSVLLASGHAAYTSLAAVGLRRPPRAAAAHLAGAVVLHALHNAAPLAALVATQVVALVAIQVVTLVVVGWAVLNRRCRAAHAAVAPDETAPAAEVATARV